MRRKSEDLSVGVSERPEVASAPSTTERELARESTIGQVMQARAWRIFFGWVWFLFFGLRISVEG